MKGDKPRIWSIGMPFKKDGWPVVGSFGKSLRPVIIMEYATWKRLIAEHPTLATTEFEVGAGRGGGMTLRKISKKRAERGEKYTLKRSPIKKKSRSAAEFKRIYGSKQRVEFVKLLPCAACGIVGLSENAHMETGGIGRKADYTVIAPLCGRRNAFTIDEERDPYIGYIGCHASLHWVGLEAFRNRFPDFDPEKAAQQTEQSWQLFIGAAAGKEK